LVSILISKLSKHLYGQILKKINLASLGTIVSPCSFFIGKTSLKWLRHLGVNFFGHLPFKDGILVDL